MSEMMLADPVRASKTDVVQFWGESVCVDCYGCDAQMIRDADVIRQFSTALVNLIEMKAFGPCHVVHFGESDRVAGFSMFQLIETSCISAHFANATNAAYIDIFSCKAFDSKVAGEFCCTFFKADHYLLQHQMRR